MRLVFFALLLPLLASAVDFDAGALQSALSREVQGFDGRVGVCVQSNAKTTCLRGDETFSLQSVVKLMVGVAMADSVDKGRHRFDEPVTVQKKDLALYVQPIAELVGESGYRTTIGDLVRRAIIDSDSAATDILIAKLGGPATVQAVLKAKGVSGIRIDRDERHLQTEIVGLTWRPEYVDAALLDRAIAAVPKEKRAQAFAKYQVDVRDTSTPRGMTSFLFRLVKGELISKSSTSFILQAMSECKTFPDRLKAGVNSGWQISHKTGTSGSWDGVTAATNDVGILTAPDGSQIHVAVFIADSRRTSAERGELMAKIASAVIARAR